MNIRKIIYLTTICFLGLIINYSPIIYYWINDVKGTWPQFYNFHEKSSNELLNQIDSIVGSNGIIEIKANKADRNNYLQIVFYDKETTNYYFTSILVDSVGTDKFSQIVFSHVGKSFYDKRRKCINKDYTLIENYYLIKKFESKIISRLK